MPETNRLINAITSDLAAFDAQPGEIERIAAELKRLSDALDTIVHFDWYGDGSWGLVADDRDLVVCKGLNGTYSDILAAIERVMPKDESSIEELEAKMIEAAEQTKRSADRYMDMLGQWQQAKAARKGGA